MKIKVVLVEPQYQINIGYASRVCMNFGVASLSIVNPLCDYKGGEAIKYAKHARRFLERAKICKNLEEATYGTLAVGTTGIWRKARGFNNIYALEKASSKLSKSKQISLVIGREGKGLTIDELKSCPANIYIPANANYRILNTSHALAIILYELTKGRFKGPDNNIYASSKEQRDFINLFKEYLKSSSYVRDHKSVAAAMKHIIERSSATKRELKTLMAGFHKE